MFKFVKNRFDRFKARNQTALQQGRRRVKVLDCDYQLLESRQLMATLLSSSSISFQDIDGDQVLISFSRPFLTATNANSVFQFSTGSVNGNNSVPQQLRSINLGSISAASRSAISTSVTRGPGAASGTVNIGQIMADGIDLSDVTIQGDLGRIRSGDSNPRTQALGALTVNTLGGTGTTFGAIDLESETNGSTRSINVLGSMVGAYFRTENGGNIGPVTIQGSILGSIANGGSIYSSGNIGNVSIGGSIFGGSGVNSGSIESTGSIGNVSLGGSIFGDSGNYSGYLFANGNMGALTIAGSIFGGAGNHSGKVESLGTIGTISVGGSIRGDSGEASGQLKAFTTGLITIAGNVQGGSGEASGLLTVDGRRSVATINGSVRGGAGEGSGAILSKSQIDRLSIAGDLRGGNGEQSGRLHLHQLSSLTLGGSVIGGGGSLSGFVRVVDSVSNMTITGNLVGGSASGTTALAFTGMVDAGNIGNFVLGGNFVSGLDATSGDFLFNGVIMSRNAIDSLTIRGSIFGNSSNPAMIFARGQLRPRGTTDLALGSIVVNGSVNRAAILAGQSGLSSTRNADAQIGNVSIGGNWSASTLGAGSFTRIGDTYTKVLGASVRDMPRVTARIASINIGGTVTGSSTAGDHFGFIAENIGSLRIGTTTYTLNSGNRNDNLLLDTVFGDMWLSEY